MRMLPVTDVASFLSISRSAAYELARNAPFPVIRIGRAIRVPDEPFYEWASGRRPRPA
ncbi:MAG: helix-turn-helix domain-containing protein [Betaproteobacteria bacterium]